MSAEFAENILLTDIEQEMKKSFITYAMSVIVSRALPDVRDGLKPVQRRILYNMFDAGNTADKHFRKSAKTVGDVLGRFHPHGDTAVYDAMVRLAQNWNLRYPLVEGQGNFGSIDGDPPAAMRYTEARLSKIAGELLTDIEKNTVDFVDNYDNTEKEPAVLPSRIPNLLVNGAAGIAVGMATNIPPHNLGEVIDGCIRLIDDPATTVEDLMTVVKGPDFPTGALILGREGVRQALQTGRGSVTMRAPAAIDPTPSGKNRITITELPYLVNKARLIERIADLVRERKIEGITDLRDESDRTGMRVVVEVRRDVNANVVLNQLYKHTALQSTFSIHMLALVDGRPTTLNLRDALWYYVQHQKDVIIRRTQHDLDKAEARAHIVEGLLKALDVIDEVIATIRASADTEAARNGLMTKFGFSETQAQHILDLQLRRLTALERNKLEAEYDELLKQIEYFRAVLASERMQYSVIRQELTDIRKRYADPRRTRIMDAEGELSMEELIQEEDIVITMTHLGYVKRLPVSTYKAQKRGGRGVRGASHRETDFIEHLFITTTHHDLLFFTDQGRCYKLKAYEVPEAGRTARGTAIINLLNLQPAEKIQAVITVKEMRDEGFLFFATRGGYVKKTPITDYSRVRTSGLIALHLDEGDGVVDVKVTDGTRDVVLVSSSGHAIRFHEGDVRAMGRDTRGVRGISLEAGAQVVGMDLVVPNAELLVATRKGLGKRTPFEDYPTYTRGARGVKTINLTDRTGDLVAIRTVTEDSQLLLLSEKGQIIRINVREIRQTGRVAQGVNIMNVGDDALVALAEVVARDEDEEE